MKSSASIAISLTLIMFILVLAAAVFFLFEGRQGLKEELTTSDQNNKTLRDQQAELELNERAVEATLETIQVIQATSAAENMDLETQLSNSEQAKSTLEASKAQQAAELENADATLTFYEAQGPVVTIVEPQNGAAIIEGQPVEIVIVASDPAGIAVVNFSVGDVIISEPVDQVGPVFTLRKNWTPTAVGTFKLTASAINGQEKLSRPSQNSEIDLTVNPFNPTNTPLPTEAATPNTTPEPTTES